MRRYVLIAFALLFASSAFAARNPTIGRYERDNRTAIGFHNVNAPLGVRLGLGEYYAVDLGVGFSSTGNVDDWALDVGVPLTLKEWQSVRLLFRPGLLYQRDDYHNVKTTTISAELEGEAFILHNFSVSGSLGVARDSNDRNDVTAVHSTGGQYSDVGFHLYLWR